MNRTELPPTQDFGPPCKPAPPDRAATTEAGVAVSPAASAETAFTEGKTHVAVPPDDAPSIPGYRIGHEIARGGMGRVWATFDLELEREVAIKTLLPRPGADPERFMIEAKITARLPHPGIPPIHKLGSLPDGSRFLAMKLIRGRTLADLLAGRAEGQPQLPRFAPIFEQVAQAVGFAHAQGILHRDLKPANVMVGAFGEVQVMDWGLAKDLTCREQVRAEQASGPAADLTTTGAIMGTPGYMAPEQARGEAVDARADVFALGSILTMILTDRPAVTGASAAEIVRKTAAADIGDALRRLAGRGADPELRDLCVRCLAPRAEDRPQDARAVAAAIADWRAGMETRLMRAEVERAEALVREAETRKRRKVWLGLAAALFAGLVVSTGLALWANHAREQEANARTAEADARRREQVKAAQKAALGDFWRYEVLRFASPGQQHEAQSSAVRVDPELKVRDLALRAAKELDGKFPDQPMVEAEIRGTLGRVLIDLGRAELAIAQFAREHELRRTHLGPDDLETLWSLSNWAGGLAGVGRHAEAFKLKEAAAEAGRRTLGLDHPDTLMFMHNLANGHAALGRSEEALRLHEEVLERRRRVLGTDHLDVFASLDSLGRSRVEAGCGAEALPLFEEALALSRRKLGPDHPESLRVMLSVAFSLACADRQAEALRFRQEALAAMTASLGADHPETLEAMSHTALSLGTLVEHERQRAMLIELIERLGRLAEAQPEQTGHALALAGACCNLASTLRGMGRSGESLAWLAKGQALLEKRLAREPNDASAKLFLRNVRLQQAYALEALGRHAEADSVWPEAIRLSPPHQKATAEADQAQHREARPTAIVKPPAR